MGEYQVIIDDSRPRDDGLIFHYNTQSDMQFNI
jgi:hypothetical protein